MGFFNIAIQTTMKCNYKCRHCMFSCSTNTNYSIQNDTIKAINNILSTFTNYYSISIFRGEPIDWLYPDIKFHYTETVVHFGNKNIFDLK